MFHALFCVQIRKMKDIKMSEAMENAAENISAEKTGETKAENSLLLTHNVSFLNEKEQCIPKKMRFVPNELILLLVYCSITLYL